MSEEPSHSKLEQLERAIAGLEEQRATLGAAAVDAALDLLRRQLADLQAVTGKTEGAFDGERKLVTVLFADISGFTSLSEKADPESVRLMINACFKRMAPVVEKYGGRVNQIVGDEIMALFGAPLAHENDPERALRTALDMKDTLAAFNTERGLDLGMHFGINTGLVVAGDIAVGERQEYAVMGDAVNVAARLEGLSQRGEILVGPDTYRLAAHVFNFDPLEPVRVKGRAEPVHIYRLVGLKAEPAPVRGLESRGISSPLVGRDAEYNVLIGCLGQLLAGQGRIVSVIGEAGVGKSRLMAEICKSAGPSDLTWLEGRTLSFGQTIRYWPFQQILWNYAGITEEDSEAEAWGKLESRVRALFAEKTREVLPYLAAMLTLEVREEYAERVKYLDGEAMGRQVFLATRRFFERLAGVQPVVLVFEDLHWVDESSALLLEHLLPLVERVPLLICGVSRPYRKTQVASLQEVAGRNFPDHYTEIHLTPLSKADSAQLVRNLLANEDLPYRVRRTIMNKAGGNPFFLEEIIRTLIDTGAVIHDWASGCWRVTTKIETITIPDTVQGVIMARVDRLQEDVRQVLRTASVVGRSFLYRVLNTIAEMDLKLDQHLAELQAIQLIREKQRIPELEYIFKHALVQETTYENILLQKRRELHARVGQAIETLFADRLEEFYGMLAYHYAQAEVWEKAQDFLLKAGDQAGRVAADGEALAHYRQAIAAYARAFGDEWDPVQRALLERKIGEALFRRGEHPQALEHLHRSLAYLGRPLPASRWGVRTAILREITQQIGHRLLPGLFLRPRGTSDPASEPVSPAVEEEIHLYELIGWIEAFSNQEHLLLAALRLLNVAERSGYAYGVVVGAVGLGLASDFVHLFGLAEGYHRRAVNLAEQFQNPRALALAYYCRAMHQLYLGEHYAAREGFQHAARIYQKLGDLHGWGGATNSFVSTFNSQGDLPQALIHSQQVIRDGMEGDDSQIVCWAMCESGFALRHIGRFDEAIKVLGECIELGEATADSSRIAAGGHLGRCYLRQGELKRALSALHASQLAHDEYGATGGTSTALRNGLAEAYLVAAEQTTGPQSDSDKAAWLRRARNACRKALRQGKAYRPGMTEAMRLQGTYEWLRGKPAAAKKWWQRSLALAEEMEQRYDLGMTHLEMGQRLKERQHLERAEVILAEVGAEWDLKQAQEALASSG